jgi:hypothetical protein
MHHNCSPIWHYNKFAPTLSSNCIYIRLQRKRKSTKKNKNKNRKLLDTLLRSDRSSSSSMQKIIMTSETTQFSVNDTTPISQTTTCSMHGHTSIISGHGPCMFRRSGSMMRTAANSSPLAHSGPAQPRRSSTTTSATPAFLATPRDRPAPQPFQLVARQLRLGSRGLLAFFSHRGVTLRPSSLAAAHGIARAFPRQGLPRRRAPLPRAPVGNQCNHWSRGRER